MQRVEDRTWPSYDHVDPHVTGADFHRALGELAAESAYLARAELAETFRHLAPLTPDLALDGAPLLGPTTGIYAVESLPLRW